TVQQERRAPRRCHRRQRQRQGAQRPKLPPVLGQGRAARRAGLHPSPRLGRRLRDPQSPQRQRPARQRDRQPARDDHRALAPDLRGHARPLPPIKKKPTEYLKQMYYDTMVFTPEGLRHLAAEVGASQLVIGTDFPYPWTKTAVDHVLGTPGLSDEQKIAILGGTAAALLGIRGSCA